MITIVPGKEAYAKAEVAEILGVSVHTLDYWHKKGWGPPRRYKTLRQSYYWPHEVTEWQRTQYGIEPKKTREEV